MSNSFYIIRVPNVLNAECKRVEDFYKVVLNAPLATSYGFDLNGVSFLLPYGVLAILSAARLLHRRTGIPIELLKMRPHIHSYLDRVKLFQDGVESVFCQTDPVERWWQKQKSITVLELTPLCDEDNLDVITQKTKQIFSAYIGKTTASVVVTMLSELCTNVLYHSQDTLGTILIQACTAHDDEDIISIRVAVSDMGCGIHSALRVSYPGLARPIEAIEAAHQGKSSSIHNRCGLGLRHVGYLATQNGGHLWLRSENAALLQNQESTKTFDNLSHIDGTQVAVEFRVKNPATTFI